MAVTINASTSAGAVTTADTSGVLQLQTGGTAALTVDASQNVGIGTSSPTDTGAYGKALDVQGSGGSAVYVRSTTSPSTNYGYVGFTGGAGNLDIWNNPAGNIRFYNNAAERMRIDTSGNVGIGTSSPATRLHVSNSSKAILTVATTGASSGSAIDLIGSTGFKNWSIGCSAVAVNGSLEFTPSTTNGGSTFSTPAVSIDSSGNLLVGTTGNLAPGRISIYPSIGGNTCISSASPSNGYYVGIFYTNTSTTAGYIVTGGSTTSYVSSSDYRLKENIAPMTGALAKVAALKPVTYKWKANGSDGQGFIAHELQAVVPDCVHGEKDAVNEDGSIKPQGIDTSFLVATLTAAIQEQQTLITALTARITALEGAAA